VTERPASNTAVGVATLRAAHQLIDQLPRILDDTVVVRLLGNETSRYIHENAWRLQSPRAAALRTHVLLRSRYAEERLKIAVDGGVAQFLVLGAGLDTFAYRQPPWTSNLRIFEVDHPASQQSKRDRLAAADIPIPANLTFVPVDFEHETLRERLEACNFDFAARAFVSCLGVLVYLTGDAVEDVFRFLGSLAPSSECVLTIGGGHKPADPTVPSLGDLAAAAGEPFRSVLDPESLAELCARFGVEPPVFPGPDEVSRYLGDRRDGLRAPSRQSIASVTVAERP
jgi:methyltransferase (TIGR00027 family)